MYGECDWFPEDDRVVDQPTPAKVITREAVSNDQPLLVIDRDIQNLCRPLTDEERRLLEEDIKVRGCIDPITCCKDPKGRNVILDGHHRYAICTRHGIPYPVKALEFKNKEEVINWVIKHQLGRRNQSPLEAAYLRGKLYNIEKKAPGKSSDSTLPQNEGRVGETAVRIAAMTGVSPATIERDAVLAEAQDTLREIAGDEFGNKMRRGDFGVSRKNIIKLSEKPPEEIKAIAEHLEQGKKFAEAEKIVNPTAETVPMDKNIHRVEENLGKIHKILSKMDTTTEPAKLGGLLAMIEHIRERIMEIGGSSSDRSSDDHETGPDSEPHEDDEIVPDKDGRAETEEHPKESDSITPEQDEDDEAEDEPEEWHDGTYGDEDEEAEFDGYGTDLRDYYTSDDVDPAALPSW